MSLETNNFGFQSKSGNESTPYTAGDGITLNGTEFDLDAVQTIITSILNAALKVGRDADNQIDFSTDNEILFRVGAVTEYRMLVNNFLPVTNGGASLGGIASGWANLFLSSSAAINFNNGDVTLTHSANALTLAGGDLYLPNQRVGTDVNNNILFASGTNDIKFNVGGVSEYIMAVNNLSPVTDNGAALGTTTRKWSDLFLNAGGNIDFDNDNASIINNTSGQLRIQTNNNARGVMVRSRNFPKTTTTDGDVQGDVVNFGGGSVVAGKCYYYDNTGGWREADRRTLLPATSFLGVAIGTGTASNVGMCIRGMVTMATDVGTIGDKVYLRINGEFDNAPTSASGEYVRLMGYVMDSVNGQIFFNPSMDWVEIA